MSEVVKKRELRYHDDPHHSSNWCLICGLYYCWHDECESHERDPLGRSVGHTFCPDERGKMQRAMDFPPEEKGGY